MLLVALRPPESSSRAFSDSPIETLFHLLVGMDVKNLQPLLDSLQATVTTLVSNLDTRCELLLDPFEPGLPLAERGTLHHWLDSYDESLASLQVALSDIFQKVNTSIVALRSRVAHVAGPICRLPVEIQIMILRWTLRDSERPPFRKQIFTLWHVSQTWRTIVRGFCHLYRMPDWKCWPMWLVTDWCSLADPGTIVVELDESLLLKM